MRYKFVLSLFYKGLKHINTVWISCFVVILASCNSYEEKATPYVVLVSFDGFSNEYLDMYQLPNFERLVQKGVKAQSLISSYPSNTFPNHYSIITGLYPDHHGLVDNSFYDRETKEHYAISKREKVEDARFYGGTPLWQLVQEHGMKSASYFWVGSEAPVKGKYPDYYYQYNHSTPNEERIGQVIEWLKLPEEDRPHFISLYFSLVDSEGHKSGPYSENTYTTIKEADALLGKLMEGLEATQLPFNLIVVSDHGMYEVHYQQENIVCLETILQDVNASVITAVNATQAHLYVENPIETEVVFENIKRDSTKYKVLRKEDMPDHWHYNSHSRIGDVLVVAEPGFIIRKKLHEDDTLPKKIGVHGYDPYLPEMGGIFLAYGKNIKTKSNLSSFENIHIYPLIARILNIKTPPIDGQAEVLQEIYKE